MKTVDIDVSKVDWKLLRQQKRVLAGMVCGPGKLRSKTRVDTIEGVLNALDDIQDQAALQLGDRKVFGK